MAWGKYDASQETQKDFGSIQKNQRGDIIKVQRIIPNDTSKLQAVDIRNMYTGTDGNTYPDVKKGGIRVNSEQIVELMTLVYKAMSPEERIDFTDAIAGLEDEEDGDYEDDLGSDDYTEQGDD